MDKKLKLEEFIYQVKKELLDAQSEHEGEGAFFIIKDVQLEVSVAATYSGSGKVNIVVAELGSNIAKEHLHKVRLTFGIVDSENSSSEKKQPTVVKWKNMVDAGWGRTPPDQIDV